MSTLPAPRTLLTSLFNTLTTTTQTSMQHQAQVPIVNEPYDSPRNPLKTLSPSHRALLSTLHVLFTPPMLLQALDLLDRGLVLRVVEELPGASGETKIQAQTQGQENDASLAAASGGGHLAGTGAGTGKEVFPPQVNVHLHSSPPPPLPQPESTSPTHQDQHPSANTPTTVPPAASPKSNPKSQTRNINRLHQVRSSQPPKCRFRDATLSSTGSASNIYTVRLEAWNCSCAAFAFASFPAASVYPSRSPWNLDLGLDRGEGGDGEDVDMGGGGFGGVGGERGRVCDRGREEGGEGSNEEEEWEFGGMSMDGKEGRSGGTGGGVPCCKHLLACVLGERWDDLKGYVKESVVSREEMAGLGCE